MKFPFMFDYPETAKEEKLSRRLKTMKEGGWKALESMDLGELDEFQAEIEDAIRHVNDFGFVIADNDHDRLIVEAREAIKERRFKIRQEAERRYHEQARRHNTIAAAADRISEAAKLCDEVCSIERDPNFWVNVLRDPFPDIDAPAMTESELNAAIKAYDEELRRTPSPDFSLFATLKTPAAEAIASELKDLNAAQRARRESARANMAIAREELRQRRRDAEAEAKRHAETVASIDEVIAGLQSRIADLEAAR